MDAQLRNLYTFAFSFFFIFTAYTSIQNLEVVITSHVSCDQCLPDTTGTCQNKESFDCAKTVNVDQDCPDGYLPCASQAGSISLSVLYLMCMATSLLGSAVPDAIGKARAMQVCMVAYVMFCMANVVVAWYPDDAKVHWFLLVPNSILTGACAAILWSAQGAYLTDIAILYAASNDYTMAEGLGYFNSVFWSLYQASQVVGNLVSSIWLHEMQWSMVLLFILYTIICIIGYWLSTTLFTTRALHLLNKVISETDLESKPLLQPLQHSKVSKISWIISVRQVLWMCLDNRMQPLLLLSFFTGLEQGFAWGSFPSHFIQNSFGKSSIGYIMAIFGMFNALGAFATGRLCARYSAQKCFLLGAIILCPTYYYLLFHSETLLSWTILVLLAISLGLGDSVFSTVLCVTIGNQYHTDSAKAFAIFKFFQSAASALSFFVNQLIEPRIQLLGLVLMLKVALGTFLLKIKSTAV